VADEDTLVVQLLRSHVIRLLRVGEHAGLHVVEVHRDGEWRIGGDDVLVFGADKLAGGHVRLWDNVAHGDRVAGTRSDLLAIGDRLSRTEVDEVVRRGQGGHLAGGGGFLTVLFEPSFHQA